MRIKETFFRHIRESYKAIKHNTWMSLASIGTVAVTLLIFGVFLIFAFNISFLTKELDQQLAVRASLEDGLTEAQKKSLIAEIQKNALVKEASYVPKEQGLQEMKESWGDAEFINELQSGDQNPLPDMILVYPNDPQQTPNLEKALGGYNGILSVDAGGGATQTLLGFSGIVRNVILIFGVVLSVLAAFLISNTIKLTIMNRQKEIEVMRLVGASNWFIRWPFLIEGAFIGIVGAIFPIGILLGLYQLFFNVMNAGSAYVIFKMMPITTLGLYLSVSTLVLGALIGISGSVLSIRRFLTV